MKFGIEIEFKTRESLRTIADKVNRALQINGQGSCSYEGYTHQVMGGWKIVTDASVHGGGECVSPILYDEAGLEALKTVLEVLDQDCTVDIQCGVHVHHCAQAMSVKQIKNVLKLYGKCERAIDGIMPRSRRGDSRWCKTVSGRLDNELRMKELEKARTPAQILSNVFDGDRYYNINLAAYIRYGTLEFRQHAGSLDFEKISAWVKLTNAIMVRAANAKGIKYGAANELNTLMTIARKGGAGDTTRFFRKRAKHFAAR